MAPGHRLLQSGPHERAKSRIGTAGAPTHPDRAGLVTSRSGILGGVDTRCSVKRPFNWGVVLLCDRATSAIPESLNADGVGRTPTCLALSVRHAQDVEGPSTGPDAELPPFDVLIEVGLGEPDERYAIEHGITVASGALTVGDADAHEEFPLRPGRYRLYVAREPDKNAERLRVWIAGVGAT